MSTHDQVDSLENQSLAIQEWAASHGFSVLKTYADRGKSGVVIRNRDARACLIQEIGSGKSPYKAVLVYDVSRWGRFQDADEAAHYEFLCKNAASPSSTAPNRSRWHNARPYNEGPETNDGG